MGDSLAPLRSDLSPSARNILGWDLSHKDDLENGRKWIMRELCLEERVVWRSLKELTAAGHCHQIHIKVGNQFDGERLMFSLSPISRKAAKDFFWSRLGRFVAGTFCRGDETSLVQNVTAKEQELLETSTTRDNEYKRREEGRTTCDSPRRSASDVPSSHSIHGSPSPAVLLPEKSQSTCEPAAASGGEKPAPASGRQGAKAGKAVKPQRVLAGPSDIRQ